MTSRYPPGRDPATGALLVNGHRPVSTALRARIVAYMERVGGPVTVTEIAAVLHYTAGHLRSVLPHLSRDGVLEIVNPDAPIGSLRLYRLPDATEPRPVRIRTAAELAAKGFPVPQIAAKLSISERSAYRLLRAAREMSEAA